jgi:FdhD protein
VPDPGPFPKPLLSQARCELTQPVDIVDAGGERRRIDIPAERALTVYVDKRELVTLMTLGQQPELLVLGWLLNQGLVAGVGDVQSVQVDWSVGAAAVRTHAGVADIEARTARRIVTTGCGQGTVFGELLAGLDTLRLPPPAQSTVHQATLAEVAETMRVQGGIHRQAGSVHGTALFHGARLLQLVEDVGRHNAVDTITGWMAMHDVAGADKLLMTTGRLTSEMVLKAARIGVPVVVSRNGITAMGHELAQRLGMTLIGRASGRRFLCYTGADRIVFDPALQASLT